MNKLQNCSGILEIPLRTLKKSINQSNRERSHRAEIQCSRACVCFINNESEYETTNNVEKSLKTILLSFQCPYWHIMKNPLNMS